jgi:hypothetical protein
MRQTQRIVVAGAVLICSAALAVGLSAQRQGTTQIARPDLQVEKIEFTTAPGAGGGTQLTIRYTLYNDSNIPSRNAPTEAGKAAWQANPVSNLMFEAKLDVRDYPSGRFQNLSTIQLELGAHGRMTGNASILVPAGKRKEFRAIADSQNWINETIETNNEKLAIWPLTAVATPIQK